MDLTSYFKLFLRWLWLIVIVAAVGAAANFYRNLDEVPLYNAEARVFVGRYDSDPDPSSNEIGIAQELLPVYIELIEQRDVLDSLRDANDIDMSIGMMRRAISTSVVDGTTILSIGVRHEDAETSAVIANGLANQLIERSPSTLSEDQLALIELAEDQIDGLQQNQQLIKAELDELEAQLETALRSEFDQINQRRLALIAQDNELSTNITANATLMTSLEDPVNSIRIFEEANVPTFAEEPNRILDIVVGAVGGAVVVIGILLLMEFFNSNLRSTRQLERELRVPTLGVVSNYKSRFQLRAKPKLINQPAADPVLLEEFRTLRAGVGALLLGQSYATIVVTSSHGMEGKSVVAANLAMIMARAGRRVCLVDADLRQPTQHKLFEVAQEPGFANILGGERQNGERPDPIDPADYASLLCETNIPNLKVIPAGYVALDANEVLTTYPAKQFRTWLEETAEFDMVIFDTPPILPVTDSAVLANSFGGSVLFNVRFDYVSVEDAHLALDRFKQLNVPILGAVLNRARRSSARKHKGFNVGRYVPTSTKALPSQAK